MLYMKRALGQHLFLFYASLGGGVVFIETAVLTLVMYHTFLFINTSIPLYFVFYFLC